MCINAVAVRTLCVLLIPLLSFSSQQPVPAPYLTQNPSFPIHYHALPGDRNWIRCQGSQEVCGFFPKLRAPIDVSDRWQSFHKEEFKLKTFKEDDVDIAIDACGVCGSDVHCKNLERVEIRISH